MRFIQERWRGMVVASMCTRYWGGGGGGGGGGRGGGVSDSLKTESIGDNCRHETLLPSFLYPLPPGPPPRTRSRVLDVTITHDRFPGAPAHAAASQR